jgi:hypothetical protein
MIDGPAEAGRMDPGSASWAARTAGSAYEVDGGVQVESDGRPLTPGARVPVRLIGSGAYDLFARLESDVPLSLLKGSA